jgi:hypothetical protein
LYLHGDLFEGVVFLEVGLLQVLPLEILFEGELVAKSECAVGVCTFEPCVVIEDKEKAGVDIILNVGSITS